MMQLSSLALATATALLFPLASAAPTDARTTDGISSCGSAWMPRDDVTIGRGTDKRRGFSSAVQAFCSAADGRVVKPNGYLSLSTEVFLNGGKNPSEYGIQGFVNFEVHNKIKSGHTISKNDCVRYLNALSADGGKCSGATNKDTKGGTWQVGSDGISYHALGYETPPKQDAVNEIFEGSAITAQSANKGAGPPLSPWPLASLDNVQPVACHSHNDYDRDVPVFSALSAGCIAVEADVFLSGGDVIIGHVLPTPGRTLRLQYTEPLRAILDHNNGGAPGGDKGIFAAHPEQRFVLMVDFKTSDAGTLDAVAAALQPLRDGGYLSSVEGGRFVQRAVTVVASGAAPFDRISAGEGVPGRDVFYDAQVDDLETKYNASNSYYASADFQSAIGKPGSVEAFSDAQRAKVKAQVDAAHAAGLKVRYWNLPGEYMWEPLAALGVDYLNADDMSNTARLKRIQ
ncbi:PLC-like phosphodiesterase, TIM beta/alpha-barrel domain protein [Cordyceps fumosorosea ARSEF 2679]|uniref:Altered inheritance of mitochondria protein 6 n=1 Tax=Cordyceps fumosorosea (strain ARSEF 2679) TaxID=1081104 RepID=A0A168B9Y7_CORFA|nr:PLC-like phosphodiesterase, TIM beta/alpha-barrel domain protein [Cordyceps fumosorosea ARSEF 2679]OAA69827.1 PLC-like phosphodiesterase, TIM beta/alpha-barrel domain protein [Cordyceps fumosorosea ARSEF 2679]